MLKGVKTKHIQVIMRKNKKQNVHKKRTPIKQKHLVLFINNSNFDEQILLSEIR